MSFGQCVVQFYCLQRGLLGSRKGLFWRNKTKTGTTKDSVAIGQAGISLCIAGIFCDGLLKVFDALFKSILVRFVPPVAALQVILIGVGIRRIAFGHALFFFASQTHP